MKKYISEMIGTMVLVLMGLVVPYLTVGVGRQPKS